MSPKKYATIFTESKEFTVKEMLAFMVDSQEFLDTYDLKEAFNRTVVSRFKQETGYYPEFKGHDLSVESIGFKIPFDNYDRVVKAFNEFIAKFDSGNKITAKEKQRFSMVDRYVRIMNSSPRALSLYVYDYGLSTMADLLFYVVLGKMADNLAPSNEWLKKNNLKDRGAFTPGDTQIKDKIGNQMIGIKQFKNGRTDISGLTPEQVEKMKTIIEASGHPRR
jgi:hypothetical protein